MSQSGFVQRPVWPPAFSCLRELQACIRGSGINSTTDNIVSEGVPDSGTSRDGGQRMCLLGGGDEHGRMVVGGDEDA